MATINLGSLKLNWTGAYNSSTSYAVDDIATANGNSYVCIQAHSNQAVGNATAYWNIMSSAGTNGSNGTDLTSTLSARGDLVFKGASALTRLPKGTAGYVLKQGANDPEWGEAPSGKVLQIKNASTTAVISSSNDLGGKHFPNNKAVSNGAQVLTVAMTPLSTTSHFYVWFTCASGMNGNSGGVIGIFCGSDRLNLASSNGYAGDIDGLSVHGVQDTSSLSGSQTIQIRNLGTYDGSNHHVNGNSGATANGGKATMTVMEIED